MKVCGKCKVEKPYDEFYNNSSRKDGKSSHCKFCQKKYYEKNATTIRLQHKEYRKLNKDKRAESAKLWKEKNRDYILIKRKEYYENNKDKRKIYLKENKTKILDYYRNYKKNRRAQDPMYRVINNLRTRIYLACKAIQLNKSTSVNKSIGLPLSELKTYIESKFQEGMTWKNYGKWHIDHIKPLSSATTEEEVIKLNHYTNLQPLWAIDNIKKSNKYE